MSETSGRVRLTEREYEQLRRSTDTHREELLVRLCGETGLRAREVARVRPGDVTSHGGQGSTPYFLTVRERNGGDREAFLSARVAHDFWQYVRSNALDTDEAVVDVTPRRIQMLVREVGERAAEWTGRPTLSTVTPSALRRFFARTLLVEHGVDPRVVTAIGGWESVDTLLPDGAPPTRDEVVAAFEQLTLDDAGETGRLRGVVATLDRVGEALSTAGSREDIERDACRALVENGTYAAAWVMEQERRRERVVARAHAGENPDRFEGSSDTTIIGQALRTGRVLVAPDRPRPTATERGLLAAIPLVHGEATYGVLVVRADDRGAFDDPERTLLSNLGRRVGLTVTATERRQLLFGDTVVTLTFQYDDDGVLVDLSSSLGCALDLEGIVAAGAHSLLCFVAVTGAPAERILEWTAGSEGLGDARLIRSYDEGGLLEVVVERNSPALPLTERGGSVSGIHVEGGRARLVAEFAPNVDVRGLVESLRSKFGSIELRSKREITPTEQTSTGFRESVEQRLTGKQESVLRAAYHAGYFEWPRGSTAEELAESMEVSSPTLHNHLRRAQQKLLSTLFAEDETDPSR
jgi:Predicted DNA binding protein